MPLFLLLLDKIVPLPSVLLYCIFIFLGCGILFFSLLITNRLRKNKETKEREEYATFIDLLFNAVISSNTSVHAILETGKYGKMFKNKKFRSMLVQDITHLHLNYTGESRLKLEEFYRKSGLINISFKKLKSQHWEKKCEGIRELTGLNIKEAFHDTYLCLQHPHDTLRLEALLGLIRLDAVNCLSIIQNYPHNINDWIQLNLLYEIDKSDLTPLESFTSLLNSKNNSIVVLGIRLCAKFKQLENVPLIRELQISTCSESIRSAAELALHKLSSTDDYILKA